MGKRSDFKRIEKDFYCTVDPRAVQALLPFLEPGTRFAEPCCGEMHLIHALASHGHVCTHWSDISHGVDALGLFKEYDPIITNPPWSRPTLHKMIPHFINISPYCWLLFDADWAHTKQSAPYMKFCTDIVSVGRLIWIPGTTMSGKDNCAWYRFERNAGGTQFHGR